MTFIFLVADAAGPKTEYKAFDRLQAIGAKLAARQMFMDCGAVGSRKGAGVVSLDVVYGNVLLTHKESTPFETEAL